VFPLEGNLVFVWLWARRLFRWRTRLPAFSARVASTWGSTSEQLHVLGHHAQACSLLAGLFVVPRIHLQPPFNENRSAFFQVLASHLRCSSPESDIDKRDFLAFFTAVSGVSPIHRDAQIADGAALRSVTHFWITRYVSKQENFVEVRHMPLIAKSFRFCHFFRRLLLGLLEPLVVLAVNFRIQFEFGP